MLVRGPDQKSRGCAMVQFKKWAAAEAAMEGLNGTTLLEGNKSRSLVVNFANPRRGSVMATPGETAIAPRKLSVSQVRRSYPHLFFSFYQTHHLFTTSHSFHPILITNVIIYFCRSLKIALKTNWLMYLAPTAKLNLSVSQDLVLLFNLKSGLAAKMRSKHYIINTRCLDVICLYKSSLLKSP